MLTKSTAQSTLQQMTKVSTSDTTNTDLLMQFWNDSRRTVGSIRGGNWPWLEIERTVLTVADQEYVYIPNDMRRVTAVRVVVPADNNSSTIYLPRLIYDEQKWQAILALRLGSNQYPYYCFQRGQQLLFNPVPSTTDVQVILMGRRSIKDANIDDYSTGNILTATPASTAIVGTGTSWTTSMAGRWVRITESNTDNKGDGQWYEIATIVDATHLTLVKPYQGTAIVGGAAAYVLAQITYEPEAYQMAPIYRAVSQWLQLNDPLHPQRWQSYAKLYDGGQESGLADLPGGLIGQMLEEAGETFDGHYISPSNRDFISDAPPYWFPWQQASGF